MIMRKSAWHLLNLAILLFLPAPLFIVAAVSVSPDRFMTFPPSGFSLIWYKEFLTSPQWLSVLMVSTAIAAGAAIASTVASLCVALALDTARASVRGAAETAIVSPLIFPHAAVGVAMVGFLVTLHLNGTAAGILLVHIILCGPFAYRPISVALQKIDSSMAEAAMSLGANRRQCFFRVTLPLLAPGIITALLFSFIISFDETTITMFLISPEVTTLPVQIYSRIRDAADPVIPAISTFLVIATLAIVLILQRTVGLRFFVNPEEELRNPRQYAE